MALSHFADKGHPPSESELRQVLASAYPLWLGVQQRVTAEAPRVAKEWGYSSPSAGWSLRLKLGKRVLLYLTPCEAHFLASMALGEKAIVAARQRHLPQPLLKLLEEAPRYAEGRGVRLIVRQRTDASRVAHLIALKLGS